MAAILGSSVFCVLLWLILKTGMADRRFASVIDSTRLFASRAVSSKTQPLRVEETL